MDLQMEFNREVEKYNWWTDNQPVVVAVSTGVDSMVLLNLLEHAEVRPRIIVAHVNHQLRKQSKTEEKYLSDYCKVHHLQFFSTRWQHSDVAHGMEEKARQFRYNFFAEVMKQNHAQILLTAHQQNDQAETVLMKLTRSSSLKEVTGISVIREFETGNLIRPLLKFKRKQIETFAKQKQIKWFEDVTNQDDGVQRNRIRHHVLPSLMAENKQAVQHLADFSNKLQQQNQLIEHLLQDKLENINSYRVENDVIEIESADIINIFEPMLQYLVQKLAPITISDNQMNEIKKLMANSAKPQGVINLGHRLELQKTYQKIKFKKLQNENKIFHERCQFMVVLNHWYELPNGNSFAIFNSDNLPRGNHRRYSEFWLKDNQLPLYVRPSKTTDRIRLSKGRSKKIRRVLIDHKVPNDERSQVHSLVTSTDEVLSILGIQESSTKKEKQTKLYVLLFK